MPVFPAVVGPKPVFWGSEYRLFHQPDVSVGDFEIGTSARIEFYFPYGGPIITPFYDFDVEIHDGNVEFFGNDFPSGEYRSVLVEESCPVMYIGGRWRLVRNESCSRLFSRCTYRQEGTQRTGFGYAGKTETGTYFQE